MGHLWLNVTSPSLRCVLLFSVLAVVPGLRVSLDERDVDRRAEGVDARSRQKDDPPRGKRHVTLDIIHNIKYHIDVINVI